MWHVRVPKGFSRATLERKAWRLRHPPEYTSGPILISLWELLVTHRLDREAHSWPQGTRAWPAEGRGRPLPSQSSASATAGPHRRVPQNSPPHPWSGTAPLRYRQTSFDCASQMLQFLQTKRKTLHQQKGRNSLYCDTRCVGWSGTKPAIPLRYACICRGADTDGVSLSTNI